MIFTISGATGSGKTTLSIDLARKLGYKHYDIGAIVSYKIHHN